MVTQDEIDRIDNLLVILDEEALAKGAPPYSVLVAHENGEPSGAFLRTAAKHGLRRPGESDADLVARYRNKAYLYHKRGIRS